MRRREQNEQNERKVAERYIELRGVRVNNLKNVSLRFPAGRLVVVTGLSGSGKSSLVFDTLYAEGQRRYVESLSAYARQFLGRMSKPEVDFISGLAPAIAIEQKSLSKNPRSTVGTVTEIYEYLKLLYARIGRIYSPVSGQEVRRHSVGHVADFISGLTAGAKVYVLSPLRSVSAGEAESTFYRREIERLKMMGFSRLYAYEASEICGMDALSDEALDRLADRYGLLVDRFVVHPEDKGFYSRVFDSVQTAFNEGDGRCRVVCEGTDKKRDWSFSNRLEADGMTFVKPSPNFFAFNNPYGACKTCGGTGQIVGESEELVIPDPSLSVYENAVACWRGSKMSAWKEAFMRNAAVYDFPVHRPYGELDRAQKNLLWKGGKGVKGIDDWFKFMDSQAYKVQYRVLSARYRGRTRCPECEGTRLRPDAAYVKVGGKSIQELAELPVSDLYEFFENLELNSHEKAIAQRMLTEIRQRLSYLLQVGVPYLSLNRASGTLSGGEAQRIHLANALGSSLVGSMYILDEPSIGLHPRDTRRLIDVVLRLRDLGNTVVVVEHDEEMMRAADLIVDVGPLAGREGGEIVFVGSPETMIKEGQSLTARYLRNELQI
ncbi:MAG: excinuclease ABC subunit A, partial [Bacteroidales bacterium]|nr:excinuclease ABC subunit A [Bacteroidales bacterium]